MIRNENFINKGVLRQKQVELKNSLKTKKYKKTDKKLCNEKRKRTTQEKSLSEFKWWRNCRVPKKAKKIHCKFLKQESF